jgi:hypothetical protein
MTLRRALHVVAFVAMFAVAAPAALAADPTPSPAASETEKPGRGPRDRPEKAPPIEITLSGTIERTTDEKGRSTFTLTSGGTTYELSAGPKWFHGTGGGPLATYVGQSVEVHGWHREGSTDVSVDTVDGTRVIPEGRPPWAGGPKVQGERHPGWKAWREHGKRGQGLGRDGAPGQLKDKPAHADADATDAGG